MKIKKYVKPETLEEAYELNQKKSARLIGGMMWLRTGRQTIATGIDLSGLGLDEIVETEEEFRIGAMATLRQLELHRGLDQYTQGAMRESVRSIVGVQFRNLATVGGSIWGRFGFSDVLTLFLAMDTRVVLYKAGELALGDFVQRKKDNDILTALIVKKRPLRIAYRAIRNTKTDFPVLTCALSLYEDRKDGDEQVSCPGQEPGESGTSAAREAGEMSVWGALAVGARPGRALSLEIPERYRAALLSAGRSCQGQAMELESENGQRAGNFGQAMEASVQSAVNLDGAAEGPAQRAVSHGGSEEASAPKTAMLTQIARELAGQIPTGSNLRAGAEYRSHLAQVLIRRNLEQLLGAEEGGAGCRN